jgi:hypothetical protein
MIHILLLATVIATSILRLPNSIDSWVKIAQIVQGFMTPVIAIFIGVITFRIQRQQAKTQRRQAETNRLQYRLTLFERRMKVFDSTQEFVVLVLQYARIESVEPLFQLLRNTKEAHLLFGDEIEKFINELYTKGGRLHAIYVNMRNGVMRQEDIPVETEIVEWFAGQTAVARDKFLKYLDFREP